MTNKNYGIMEDPAVKPRILDGGSPAVAGRSLRCFEQLDLTTRIRGHPKLWWIHVTEKYDYTWRFWCSGLYDIRIINGMIIWWCISLILCIIIWLAWIINPPYDYKWIVMLRGWHWFFGFLLRVQPRGIREEMIRTLPNSWPTEVDDIYGHE